MFCVNSLTGRTAFSFSLETQHALVRLLAPAGLTHTFDSSYLRDPNFRISDRSDLEWDCLSGEGEPASRQWESAAPGYAAPGPESETPRKCLNQGRSYVPAPAALVTAGS